MASRLTEASGQVGRGAARHGAQSADLTKLSISEAAALVRKKKVSPVELTRACLARIEQLNSMLNAFITVTAESALVQAREAEAEVQRGKWRGPLHGIPIGLKDLFDTAGVRTTAGSALFKDRVPTQDAEVVRRLKAAGAFSWQAQHARVRLRRRPRSSVTLARCTTPGNWTTSPAVLPAGQLPRWQPNSAMEHSGQTREAPFGALSLLQHCRFQAHLRLGEHARRDPAFLVPGPCWTHDSYGSRCSPHASGNRRLRCRRDDRSED